VKDVDGNGKVNIEYVVLYVGDTEVGRQNQERMYLYMTQDEVSLYLMSDDISSAYTNPELEYFTDDLSEYDLPYDEQNPIRADLSGNPVLTACGMEDIYLSIMDWTTIEGGSTAKNSLENALAMANALIEAGEN
jgi:hypothetical protein